MSDDKKIIELDGEKYETVGKLLDPICCGYSVIDGSKLLIVRPVPKPLIEEYRVYGRGTGDGDYNACKTREDAIAKARYYDKEFSGIGPHRVIHMREVREEK